MIAPDDGGTIRVLVLTDHVGGGTGRHLLALHHTFDPVRVSMSILSTGRVHFEGPDATDVLRVRQAQALHRFPVAQAWNVREIARTLRHRPVHVLHTYGFWPIVYGRLLRRAGVVRHLMENREAIETDWRPGSLRVLHASRSLPERVVCVSRAVAEHVESTERLDEGKLRVIENGVPGGRAPLAPEEARRRLGIPPSSFVVGAVASHLDRPVKGLSFLVDAMSELVTHVSDARLLLVGAWSPHGPTIEALRRRHLLERALLMGHCDDVSVMYAAMDALAMPSLSEGLPLAILEAMSNGLPVVASRVGGTHEVVIADETGFLVPSGDPAALSARLLSLARLPTLRLAMGAKARRRFEERFQISGTAQRYARVYAELAWH